MSGAVGHHSNKDAIETGAWRFSCPSAVGAANSSPMKLTHCLKMDPHLLIGLINTELRNHCESLDDLVKTHDLVEEELVAKLAAAGYIYQDSQNQFR